MPAPLRPPSTESRAEVGPVRHPLSWVPTAYLAEGIPFAIVIWVSGTMLKDLGHGDGQITLATASIGLAWSLKPFWAAFLDMRRTKNFFVLCMQWTMAVLLLLCAAGLQFDFYFHWIIGVLWLLAFTSATQDICIDGVYLTALDRQQQAALIGVQGVAWNVGRIFGTAVIVWTAGELQEKYGMSATLAWSWALGLSAMAMALLALYHARALPTGARPAQQPHGAREVVATFIATLRDFFAKKQIWGMLLFIFLYRSGEGFLLVEAPLFLQAPLSEGGVGLTLKEKGLIDGTLATVFSLLGGLAGGAFIARFGLRRSLLFMALCMNVPHVCFVILSQLVASSAEPVALSTVATLVTIEKFGYSFGFVANMLYMMQQVSPGRFHMTHYAFCTALMNLVLVPTQMASGPLADWLGYQTFFVFVMVASIPSVIVAWLAPFPNEERRADAR